MKEIKRIIDGKEVEYEPDYAIEEANKCKDKLSSFINTLEEAECSKAEYVEACSNIEDDFFEVEQYFDEWKGIPEFDDIVKCLNIDKYNDRVRNVKDLNN